MPSNGNSMVASSSNSWACIALLCTKSTTRCLTLLMWVKASLYIVHNNKSFTSFSAGIAQPMSQSQAPLPRDKLTPAANATLSRPQVCKWQNCTTLINGAAGRTFLRSTAHLPGQSDSGMLKPTQMNGQKRNRRYFKSRGSSLR